MHSVYLFSKKEEQVTMLRSVGFAFLMLLSQIGAAMEERMEHDYYKYHPMTEITSWMEQIVREHSSLVSTVAYGKTFENRTISLLKIGERTSGVAKKAIWMDCGIHAREWIAPAFCQYFVREILEAYNKTDPKMREMMKNVDFYVTPVLNVDGYIYSWTDNTTRLWRKSRSPGPKDCVCFGDGGTDLNRNFDALWGTVGMSRNCCSLVYGGAGPLSEPESQAVTEFVGRRKADILCFLTIHSYGQMVLVPYGHPNIISPNHNELMEVGLAAADAIQEVHGTSYTVGISHDILYPHSGLSMDWARLVGIPFSFCFELRDKGQHGFELPEEQVRATCEEAYAGVLHVVRHVHDKIFCRSGAVALTATTTTLWTTLLVAAWVTGCTTAL